MKNKMITGVISTIAKGAGFIDDPDPKKDSIYIEPGFLNTALNGDTVEVILKEVISRGKKEVQGEVTRIVNRAKTAFVGVIDFDKSGCSVIPDDKKMYVQIVIPNKESVNLKKDDKVYVRLMPWTNPKLNPHGQIIKVLGKKGENDVEIESIVLDKGFAIGFPTDVEKEAIQIGVNEKKISQAEITKRRDIRNILTFTIDPADAKDFDDAISFQKMSEDLYEIGVHIADVSHYVREGTQLDKEAVKRGCSIYLVDRTIPMLPEVLSNDICSLNPKEDKLSFSAIFIMNSKAQIKERWFGKTVMNSHHRFTYESAQDVINGKAMSGSEYKDVLITLDKIAKILQKDKFLQGAIEFEQDEVKFKLDDKGHPVSVYIKERLDTHKLVEEFMLLANREVAKYIFDSIKNKGKKDTGSIYRIHDTPDKDKIRELKTFVEALGYELPGKNGEVTAQDINHLLDQIEGTPHESLIRTATIRSMQKAIYSTQNIGHFGLAFPFYTHFTSPIRRYPDLLVHRILMKHLHNEPFRDSEIVAVQKIAETSTQREIDAAEAERASKKLKQVEYMSTRVGKVFEGKISGVSKWGIYVEEIESRSEGMINFGNLGSDYYIFDKKSYSIIGEKTKKKYTLGDQIKFKVLSADLDKKVLDYAIV